MTKTISALAVAAVLACTAKAAVAGTTTASAIRRFAVDGAPQDIVNDLLALHLQAARVLADKLRSVVSARLARIESGADTMVDETEYPVPGRSTRYLMSGGGCSASGTLNDYGPAGLVIVALVLLFPRRLLSRAAAKQRARNGTIRTAASPAPVSSAPPPLTVTPGAFRPLVTPSRAIVRRAPDPLAPPARNEANDATVVDSFAAIRSMLLEPPNDEAVTAPHAAQPDHSDRTVIDSYASMRARLQIE